MEDFYEKQIFNMAQAFTFHLYQHIVFCSDYAMKGDVEEWAKALRSLFRKIIPFIKDEEEDKIRELFDKIDWETYNHFKKNKNSREFNEVLKEIIDILEEIEEEIMTLLKKYGLLMPDPEDPRFAVLKR